MILMSTKKILYFNFINFKSSFFFNFMRLFIIHPKYEAQKYDRIFIADCTFGYQPSLERYNNEAKFRNPRN